MVCGPIARHRSQVHHVTLTASALKSMTLTECIAQFLWRASSDNRPHHGECNAARLEGAETKTSTYRDTGFPGTLNNRVTSLKKCVKAWVRGLSRRARIYCVFTHTDRNAT
jgi:hypothetical protein